MFLRRLVQTDLSWILMGGGGLVDRGLLCSLKKSASLELDSSALAGKKVVRLRRDGGWGWTIPSPWSSKRETTPAWGGGMKWRGMSVFGMRKPTVEGEIYVEGLESSTLFASVSSAEGRKGRGHCVSRWWEQSRVALLLVRSVEDSKLLPQINVF